LIIERAKASEDVALIAQQKLRIAKLERPLRATIGALGASDRSVGAGIRELEASATEDELAAEVAVAKTTSVRGFTRKRPERNTFPITFPRTCGDRSTDGV